jgi:hypothetical protein
MEEVRNRPETFEWHADASKTRGRWCGNCCEDFAWSSIGLSGNLEASCCPHHWVYSWRSLKRHRARNSEKSGLCSFRSIAMNDSKKNMRCCHPDHFVQEHPAAPLTMVTDDRLALESYVIALTGGWGRVTDLGALFIHSFAKTACSVLTMWYCRL